MSQRTSNVAMNGCFIAMQCTLCLHLPLDISGSSPLCACMLPNPQDSMTSFSVSEDGQLYSALTSNNTCALLDVGVSQGKAAWEFLLEDDSPRYEVHAGA